MDINAEYNGWTNRATWCVNLWLNNDERAYKQATQEAYQCLVANDGDVDAAARALAAALRSMHREYVPYMELARAGGSTSVKWQEIAEGFVEDVDVDAE